MPRHRRCVKAVQTLSVCPAVVEEDNPIKLHPPAGQLPLWETSLEARILNNFKSA